MKGHNQLFFLFCLFFRTLVLLQGNDVRVVQGNDVRVVQENDVRVIQRNDVGCFLIRHSEEGGNPSLLKSKKITSQQGLLF